ncbi:hypothetical protein F2Q68_00024039 [Brassica cretica]|uniref:F-box domain-containing protein n=1 Tax=Brassica cretica TaxID=69181 RepID=A0A8S9IL76_BRACR|nr:hypothetical protein F2Q68_00024039 [Brassica cretica]
MADDRKIKGAVDLISNLPDVILHHILCFISTKLAISTSLLSRRWRHVWCDIPSISLKANTLTTAASINKTLNRYTAPKTTNFTSKAPGERTLPTSTGGSSALCHTTLRIFPWISGVLVMMRRTRFLISSTTVLLSSNLYAKFAKTCFHAKITKTCFHAKIPKHIFR